MKRLHRIHDIGERAASLLRAQSPGEELANTLSHGVGLAAAVAAAPVLLGAALERQGIAVRVGMIIFAVTLVLLYLGSTLYHSWPRTRMKYVLQVVDHSAIFLLIAGTYTPFTLGPLGGPWGWSLLVVIWSLAIFGVFLKLKTGVQRPRLSVSLYLAMGWLIVLAARPLALHVPFRGLLWLGAGGIAYTSGVIFFANERLRYSHFIWHLFVLAGTGCHFCAVLWYAS